MGFDIFDKSDGTRMLPLFWQRGEDEDTLRNTLKIIQESGCDAVCVESRPHPDFMGEGWWHDLDILLDECKKRGMRFWVFDDLHFPSGYAAGHAEGSRYRRMMLTEKHMDVIGPVLHGAFTITPDDMHFEPDEGVVAVVAAKRREGTRIDHNSFINIGGLTVECLVDITDTVQDGMAYWDVPEGTWRVFVMTAVYVKERTPPRSFTNPLLKEGTELLIKAVYEPHYLRYKDEFGKTFMGFFSDEPALRAGRGYHAVLGAFPQIPVPWCQGLLSDLNNSLGRAARRLLPGLWYDIGEDTPRIRYAFMDTVSGRYGENYCGMLGDWCRSHGAQYIGHVIEQNNAHSRLGSGAGHFFRAIGGQDMAGIDVVLHEIRPGFKKDSHAWASQDFEADDDFFYYMLGQMAVSAAHLDEKKKGRTLCEIFGAYGWQESMAEMRFLADFMLSRGVNYFAPHAFSMVSYPDPDSPPHLYAGGKNPLYRHLPRLFHYMRRVASLIDGGRHISRVAVLYHAEAEWACGYDCMKTQEIVKVLNQRQVECEIVPAELIEKAEFDVLIIPQARLIPKALCEACQAISQAGKAVLFVNKKPNALSHGEGDVHALLKECGVVPLDMLYDKVCAIAPPHVKSDGFYPDVKLYPYQKDGDMYLLLFNENIKENIRFTSSVIESRTPCLYDPMAESAHGLNTLKEGDRVSFSVILEPAQLLIVVFSSKPAPSFTPRFGAGNSISTLHCRWQISLRQQGEDGFTPYDYDGSLPNITAAQALPRFSGTVRYEAKAHLPTAAGWIDLGNAAGTVSFFVDGSCMGTRFSPPYAYPLPSGGGMHQLMIELDNTAVHVSRDRFSFFACIPPTGVLGPVTLHEKDNIQGE